MTGKTNEVEVWIAMNEAGDYEVGRDEDAAIDRLEETGGGISRRLVRLRVTMAAPVVSSADVSVPDEAGQVVKAEIG
jgi:hypothetical protein